MLERINIATELKKEKEKDISKEILSEAISILNSETDREENIFERIHNSPVKTQREITIISDDVFSIELIKKIAINYRLRFLDSKLFKCEIPYEAVLKIKELEKRHKVKFSEFKILAPASLFKLEDRNKDPLLFAKFCENKFLLIYKWGNDLNPFRKIIAFPFRNIKNFALTFLIIALLIAIAVPAAYPIRLFIFLLTNIFFASMFAHIGYIRLNQNLSEFEWDSKFVN